ncbi:MAG: CRISPR-associated endonuclease Cas2 [Treponema sp.]|uniref:CRISPR-associated endonuclease Cas2 n=1 Tax=Treponema sp. TaxID=166 RepID=UPI0025FBD0AF|nr:CRISPR-associated endonuclease Cas2 [Treponema sp.]MBQ9282139.1 CRISPR-associated endonuclease Cas2 [Treponema sp.]MBR1722093.1 CRISPR-associated endonuclease Cas2 [Treponema sp.]
MSFERFNAYKIMWLFCLFDLPTNTKKQRKVAAEFRKKLIEDGFDMMQFSVYKRFCGSAEACEVHIKRIKQWLPKEGTVSILKFTDKQFGDIETFVGMTVQKTENKPQQLEFF